MSLVEKSNAKLTWMPNARYHLAWPSNGGHTRGCDGPMTLVLHGVDRVVRDGGVDGCLDIAFVNNMPDSALEATESQFVQLIGAASAEVPVRLLRFTLPTIERGESAARHIRDRYLPLDALWESKAAALIITGCEPRSADLTREPYWDQLAGVLEWARDRATSTIASCLAAHAALLLFDGAQRRRLPDKCCGVYQQAVRRTDPLAAGLPDHVVMPHSRLNEVPMDVLTASGYRPLISSDEIGWSVALKDLGGHLLVLMQGHPEYGAHSLLLEYRRDIRRYLLGERATYPAIPVGCFSPSAEAMLGALRDQATKGERDPRLIERFPTEDLRAHLTSPWWPDAVRLYANWLVKVRRRAGLRVMA
jgi:homoserine O-succinyltransferase